MCLLAAAGTFTLESRCTVRLLRLGLHHVRRRPQDAATAAHDETAV
ncbi:MAG: hypothetical protein INR64_18415 [Caulobacteraceae bacterium]|nr:hypothetical protein [Caulobacter sp.]